MVYAPVAMALVRAGLAKGIAHITGGGLPGNLPRVLPAGTAAVLRRGSWSVPRIFDELQRLGEVSDDEMAAVFNLGVGMVVVVSPADEAAALEVARAAGADAVAIGHVVAGDRTVSMA